MFLIFIAILIFIVDLVYTCQPKLCTYQFVSIIFSLHWLSPASNIFFLLCPLICFLNIAEHVIYCFVRHSISCVQPSIKGQVQIAVCSPIDVLICLCCYDDGCVDLINLFLGDSYSSICRPLMPSIIFPLCLYYGPCRDLNVFLLHRGICKCCCQICSSPPSDHAFLSQVFSQYLSAHFESLVFFGAYSICRLSSLVLSCFMSFRFCSFVCEILCSP